MVRLQQWVKTKTWESVKRFAKRERMTLNVAVDRLLSDAMHKARREKQIQEAVDSEP